MSSLKNERRIPELLAPAGSPESLRAAVNAGADAVYIGGKRYGARAYAENPDEDSLIDAIHYAHLHSVRVHLTVNTLMKETELQGLPTYMAPYYEAGLDAAIVQDAGAFSLLHSCFPLLPLHASTQTTVTGPESGLFWKQLGAVRLIPARELSLEEIKEIKQVTGLEVETFVHGALCFSYSGQCLMSSLIGGRSGNRGRCAQTCRLPYAAHQDGKKLNRGEERYLLSCRDLCSLDLIPALIEAGIDSFKIEGRMKSPRYTAGVVSIWRHYLDLYRKEGREGFHVEPGDRRRLLDLFDRGGQTEGYYFQHNGRDMLALREKPAFREGNQELNEELDHSFVNARLQLPIQGNARFAAGEEMRLSLRCTLPDGSECGAAVCGAVPEPAKKMEATEEELRARLNKTGDTDFYFERLDISLQPGLFLPVGQINALRREAIAALRNRILSRSERAAVPPGELYVRFPVLPGNCEAEAERTAEDRREERRRTLHVSCETEEQLESCLRSGAFDELSFEADAVPAERWMHYVRELHRQNKRALLALPAIFRSEAYHYFRDRERCLLETGFDGFLIRSLEEPGFLRRCFDQAGRELPALYYDFQVYAMNRRAAQLFKAHGAHRLTLPVELNAAELRLLNCEDSELVVSGRLPMMVTAQCLKKTLKGCDHRPGMLTLKDRRGMEMPVKNHCSYCCNVILNAEPLSLTGLRAEVERLNPVSVRVLLTTESAAETERILTGCREAFIYGRDCAEPYPSYTRGHMRRGVE